MTEKKIYIGTSGWMYKDWGKTFYPPGLKKGHLTYLSGEFNTVEVNTSFYHLPALETFQKWRDETPQDFIFSVKLSRYITHQKKLKGIRVPFRKFLRNAKGLGSKLHVVLIQLPPFLQFNKNLLTELIETIKIASGQVSFQPRFALEPRHESWMKNHDLVCSMLQKEKIALVFPHSARIPSFAPVDQNVTADLVYIRFHGPSEFAASGYGARRLAPWAKRIKKWHENGLEVFAYFNNDINGHAIEDARTLKSLIG
jgi:uncharacterized protein YecE (DUF72 family)